MAETTASLGDVLRDQRDRIVARFVNELQRTGMSPTGAPRALLADHIPHFLDELVREPGKVHASPNARRHGEQRWAMGYDLRTLVQEYSLLRACILATAKDFGVRPTLQELEQLMDSLESAVADAVNAYTEERDRELTTQKQRLEFLAEAGRLLSSSLDYRSTINRLTGLVVPRLADWCAIHLDGVAPAETPIAHVDPAKRDTLRELLVRHPSPTEPPYGYLHVIATGEPQLVPRIADDEKVRFAPNDDHLALIRSFGTCSFIAVPLRVQETTFGALMLGYSDSKRTYDDADLALAREVGARAAIAIDNARLFARSQEARARVEAATRAKDEFVAMLSHELRTPLNAILGWVRLHQRGAIDKTKIEHALDVIGRNAEAQNRLVDELLDVSRVLTGNLRIAPAQVDLSTVVELAVEAIRPAAEAKRIGIALHLQGDSLLRADGERLQQVAWNLVANAVKFTPKGGSVSVRVERVDSDLLLSVRDDGEGIAPEFLPYVFEIFRQADTSTARPHGGLGIGLSVTKHIVELHGGTIEIASDGPGRGTVATVCLPISPLVSTTVGVSRVPAALARNPTASPDLAGVRVLVVDDDPDARELLVILLSSAGAEVATATTVSEALAAAASFAPHVLCSDIGLADEDGYALIRRVRSVEGGAGSEIPAIALTARGHHEDRTRALVEGFNRYFAKPVEPSVLLAAVRELAPPSQKS